MYEKHFRLRELPFNLTPDPRFLYTHPSCEEAFATVCYGVENRKGIVLITGAAGTGKTTLIKLFMEKAAPRVRAACLLDPHLSFVELLQCALDAFGVTPASADRFSLIQQFREYLLEQHDLDHRTALLLDESQDIEDEVLEELRLISDLEHAGDKLVQLVLAGQSEFESRLDQPRFHQLRQRVILRSRLEPLGQEEIGSYIDFRLRTAGYSGRPMFPNPAVQRIGYFSHGIPRLINVICDHALLIACATRMERIGAETIDEIAEDLHLAAGGSELTKILPPRVATPTMIAGVEKQLRADKFKGELRDESLHVSTHRSTASESRAAAESLWIRATRFRKKWWLELPAVASLGLVILGGIYLMRPESGTISPTTQSSGSFQEGLTPLWRGLYRVLGRGAAWQTPVKETYQSYTNFEARELYGRLGKEKVIGDGGKRAQTEEAVNRAARRDPLPTTEAKRAPLEGRTRQMRRPELSSAGFAVVGNSYVREKPASKAEVIATLRPGTRIQVVGRTGEYFRVRSLDNEAIRGYVHKEDAFFEPYR